MIKISNNKCYIDFNCNSCGRRMLKDKDFRNGIMFTNCLREMLICDNCLQELNRKIVEHLAEKNL